MVIVDRGNGFLAELREMIINDYGIIVNPITSRNPQANVILERVHQTIGNILHTFKVQNMVLDDKNARDNILASTMFNLRAAVHCPQAVFKNTLLDVCRCGCVWGRLWLLVVNRARVL